ncbi:MAG: 50S ribosomal protein L29 [Phycisphaerae bacterium]|nr:50S ribosomal protein L29 [Phycisphaerae bacterium]NIW94004.1 50S ribosomal protein L29 [Phycisphaerae bacterium]NIW99623.1 50S ribosomal protein L29 [Phycisphaerae bacterium]NIX29394.1 50S ribosomal protein L29 [Phycisphaerae bacterium]
MYASEIRELSLEEIEQKLEEAYQELFNLRFQTVVSQLRDYNRVNVVKRDIARLKTIAYEKRLQSGE